MKKVFLGLLISVFSALVLSIVIAQPVVGWRSFEEGSWVTYELPDGRQQKQTLISKTDSDAVIKYENILEGNVVSVSRTVPLESEVVDASGDAQEQEDIQESTEDFSFKGGKLSCTIYERQTAQGVSKSWVSEEVPGGIVQSESNGKITAKLIDYEAK